MDTDGNNWDEDFPVFGERPTAFKIGPWMGAEVENFLAEYRTFRKSQEACAECKQLNEAEPNSPARLMCGLHIGWGTGICWKRGD